MVGLKMENRHFDFAISEFQEYDLILGKILWIQVVLKRKASAFRVRAERAYSNSSYPLTKITETEGCKVFATRISSKPFIFGMQISEIIKSRELQVFLMNCNAL